MSYRIAGRLERALRAVRATDPVTAGPALHELSDAVEEAAGELRTSWDASVECERELCEALTQIRLLVSVMRPVCVRAH